MLNEYSIVPLKPELLKDVQSLFYELYRNKLPVSFFEKKFNTTFTGEFTIGHLAYYSDGTPVAYYGVFPCIVEFHGQRIFAAQNGDTMTHSKHRGKGLFTILAKRTNELAIQKGVNFIFGFPNKNAYPGLVNKLGWIHKENMKLYKIKFFAFPIA
jgi:hypothetical protein